MTNEADNFREMLSAHVDGELSESDARRLEAAMQKDPSLAQEMANLRKVVFMLRHMGREKVGEEFASRVMARAERANLVGGPAHGIHHTLRPSLIFKWGAVAAAVVMYIGAAALVHYVINPGRGTGADQLVANDHKKDSHLMRSAPPSAAPSVLAKPSGKTVEGAHRGDLADGRKLGSGYKHGEASAVDKDKSGLNESEKFAREGGYKQRGDAEVLYTTNLGEARKGLEQVLARIGVSADAATNDAKETQLNTGTRNLSKGAVGKTGGDVAADKLETKVYAYKSNFKAIQNNDKQVTYEVLASRSQVPQIRSELSLLRGTSYFGVDSVDGKLQSANGRASDQLDSGKSSQQVAHGSLTGNQPSLADMPGCGTPSPSAAPAAGAAATLPCGRATVSAKVGRPLLATSQPAAPKESKLPDRSAKDDGLADTTGGRQTPPQTKALGDREECLPSQKEVKSQELLGQTQQALSQSKTELSEDTRNRVAQGWDESKRIQDGGAQTEQQVKESESVERLLITINVVEPANQAGAAPSKIADMPASSPATLPTRPAVEHR